MLDYLETVTREGKPEDMASSCEQNLRMVIVEPAQLTTMHSLYDAFVKEAVIFLSHTAGWEERCRDRN